jgi:hypothetical protein
MKGNTEVFGMLFTGNLIPGNKYCHGNLIPKTTYNTKLIFYFADLQKFFFEIMEKDQNLSIGIAAINTLLMVLEKTECKFFQRTDCSLN